MKGISIEDNNEMNIYIMESYPHQWSFVQGNHWSPVDFITKGQQRGALLFALLLCWTNWWANSRVTGDAKCNDYDATVMKKGDNEMNNKHSVEQNMEWVVINCDEEIYGYELCFTLCINIYTFI